MPGEVRKENLTYLFMLGLCVFNDVINIPGYVESNDEIINK